MRNWNAVVIEDDPDVRELLTIVLTQSGFVVEATADGPAGLAAIGRLQPLVTTCDVSMPGMDGLAVARRIREFSETYLIMISSKGEEIDVVQGLESGADDYVVKPFSPREVRARIEAMIRRLRARGRLPEDEQPTAVEPAPAAAPDWVSAARTRLEQETLAPVAPAAVSAVAVPAAPVAAPVAAVAAAPVMAPPALPGGALLQHNGLRVDLETRVVTSEAHAVEDLTRSEFDLLAALLESGRRVRSKADLVLALRGQGHVTSYFVNEADKRSVEVHVANLRRKIGDNATTPVYVETVRGVGYRLAPAR